MKLSLNRYIAGRTIKALLVCVTIILTYLTVPSSAHALQSARSYTNVSTGDVFLGGAYIEIGISKYGSFGTTSGQSKPVGFYGTASRNHIGMSSNAAGFGETPDTRIDYFLPGNPEERWAVGYKVGGTPTTASNAFLNSSTGISNNTVTNQSSGSQLKATSIGTLNAKLEVTQVITFEEGDKYFKNTVTLKNVGDSSIDSVRFMRTFDPDNTADKGGASSTKNQVLFTHAAGDGKAVVMADTSNNNSDPVYLVNGSRSPILFYTSDERARVSVFGFTNSNPYAADAYDSAKAKGYTVTADQAITITVDVGTLGANTASTFTYFTSLDNRDFTEVLEEIEEAELSNVAPSTPSSLGPSLLVTGSATASAQPTFAFSLADTDATNSAKFRIQLDDTSNFSSPLIDYISNLAVQGVRTFSVGQAEGGGTYLVGEEGQTLTNGSYYWRVKALDDFEAESAYAVANSGEIAFVINTATPEVSEVVAQPSTNSTLFSWNTTDAGTTQVEYGLVSSYGFETAVTDTAPRVTEHIVTINSLKACTRYFFRVKSSNNTGVLRTSELGTFTTTGCSLSSIVTGSETNIPKETGGDLSHTTSVSTVTLTIPAEYASRSASFQINRLEENAVISAPTGKKMAEENVFDLIAVTEDDTELTSFDEALTFVVHYTESVVAVFEEQTLDVYYYNPDAEEWQGLGCVNDVSARTLTCSLTHFSTYAVFGTERSSSSSSHNSSQQASSQSGTTQCGEDTPSGIPHLFQIDATNTTATVYFTPVSNTTDYWISYSTRENAEEHGTPVSLSSEGVQSFEVKELLSNTNYFFKVRAFKGCKAGDWSNILRSQPEILVQRDPHNTVSQKSDSSVITETLPTAAPTASPVLIPMEQKSEHVSEAEQTSTQSVWERVRKIILRIVGG